MSNNAQPIYVYWKTCTECGEYETAVHGQVKCPNCECHLTAVALAGAIVDSRGQPDDRMDFPIRLENRHGRQLPVFDCVCHKTLVAEDTECDHCGARYEVENGQMKKTSDTRNNE